MDDETSKQHNICLNEYQPVDDLCINNLFDKCDIDQNGLISLNELKQFLEVMRKRNKISQTKLERLYNKADKNNDNMIDREEFQEMIKDPLFHRYLKGYCDIFLPVSHREDEYTFTPYGIITISLIQLIMHVIDVSISDNKHEDVLCQNLALDPAKKDEVWRYFTYMFIHDGWSHLIFNLLLQIILGTALEIYHRSWRIAIIYFSGGFAGSLATALIQSNVRLIGASGGVYGILAAHLSKILLNFSEMWRPLVQLVIFAIWIAVDCFISIININSSAYKTGYVAHLFGMLAGLLTGIFVLRNFKIRRFEVLIQKIAIISYAILMTTMMFATVFN